MRLDLHEGFHLSPIRDGDQAAYIDHFGDKETTERLLLVPYPYTQQDADAWVQARLAASPKRLWETEFALRRPDDFLIGGIGLILDKGVAVHRAELGYWVAKDYRRRGLAGRALRAIVDYAFHDLDLKRLQAWVFPDNTPSHRVLENAGFQREGLLKGYHLKNGVLRDACIYGLVKTEDSRSSQL